MKSLAKTTIAAVLIIVLIGSVVLSYQGQRSGGRGGQQLQNRDSEGGPQGFGRPCPQGGFEGQLGPGQMQGGPGRPQGPGPGLPILGLLRQLELQPEQQEQVRTILDESKEGMETAGDKVREAMMSLNEAAMAGADPNAIHTAAAKAGQALGHEAVLKAQVVVSIKKILTDEQLARLEKLLAEAKERPQRPGFGRGPGRFSGQGGGQRPQGRRRQRNTDEYQQTRPGYQR